MSRPIANLRNRRSAKVNSAASVLRKIIMAPRPKVAKHPTSSIRLSHTRSVARTAPSPHKPSTVGVLRLGSPPSRPRTTARPLRMRPPHDTARGPARTRKVPRHAACAKFRDKLQPCPTACSKNDEVPRALTLSPPTSQTLERVSLLVRSLCIAFERPSTTTLTPSNPKRERGAPTSLRPPSKIVRRPDMLNQQTLATTPQRGWWPAKDGGRIPSVGNKHVPQAAMAHNTTSMLTTMAP